MLINYTHEVSILRFYLIFFVLPDSLMLGLRFSISFFLIKSESFDRLTCYRRYELIGWKTC